MHRAFSFPATSERSRTKERLEASLSGLCELELRKQRQECLVLGALALGDPLLEGRSGGELAGFSSWGQENLTLRRQLSALQSTPWGLMQALEQQAGDLRIDAEDGGHDGAQAEGGDSWPSSGFYESSEGQSPKGRSCSAESTEAVSSWSCTNDRPKSVGDPLMLSGGQDGPVPRAGLPRSFSAPYPPLEGIAEEGGAGESWQWDASGEGGAWQQQQQPAEGQVTQEDYQLALRVEGYILGLIQRYTLPPRPCQPRTTLSPDPQYSGASGHGSLHRRTPSLTTEQHFPDPHFQPHGDLSANPKGQGWGCDLQEGEACGGEAPSLEEDCYLALPYPQSRPHSLAERLQSPLPSVDPNCGVGALDFFCEPPTPQQYLHPQVPIHPKHNLVSAQYIPGQACHAPVRSPRHYNPEQAKPNRAAASPDHPKARASKKSHNERQRAKKSGSKASRSQSENSLLGQRVLPERRYSTTERHHGRGEPSPSRGRAAGQPAGGSPGGGGGRRWCSNVELSQDEGEATAAAAQSHRRPPRKVRHGPPGPPQAQAQHQNYQQHGQRWHPDYPETAPLCRGEEGYGAAAAAAAAGGPPVESESSMSEVYSPASSSLSSDSDGSGGLVWPQQLPPRLASTSSSSSPSPQAAASAAASQPKAFVKIKASHALKKKILRFRSGSLKVMTTV